MYLDETKFAMPEDVVSELLQRWQPETSCQAVSLEAALGRICVADVYSLNTFPVCRAAGSDGIAVKGRDFETGLPDPSNWVKGVDYGAADTGDDFDDAFDTVISVESLVLNGDGSFAFKPELSVNPGQRVIPRGSSLQAGEALINKGARITPMHLWMLASGGYTTVDVYKKPVLAYIPTGSELIEAGMKPMRGQNIQSAGIMFQAQLKLWGAEMIQYPVVKDDYAAIKTALEQALTEADIVMLSGGSCKGSEDFTARIVAEHSSYFQHGVRTAPGRPAGMGIVDGKPVINLPGPPFGAFTILDWCVRRLVYASAGTTPPMPVLIKGTVTKDVKKPPFPYQFTLRVNITANQDGYAITPLLKARTAASTILGNGLLVVPPDVKSYTAGDTVTARLLYDL